VAKVRPVPSERKTEMPEFMLETWFMGLMGVLLLGLIGLFFYMRNQKDED
jgi:LPXTG-motif cell wall-anchored protein